MTHSPADVVRFLLIDLGLGTHPDDAQPWPVYATGEPSVPDNCITVYNGSWRGTGRSMVTGETYQHYGVAIRIRATNHTIGWAKAIAISAALDEDVYDESVQIPSDVGTMTVDYDVHSAHNTDVIDLGEEIPDSQRCVFTINPYLTINPAA